MHLAGFENDSQTRSASFQGVRLMMFCPYHHQPPYHRQQIPAKFQKLKQNRQNNSLHRSRKLPLQLVTHSSVAIASRRASLTRSCAAFQQLDCFVHPCHQGPGHLCCFQRLRHRRCTPQLHAG